MDTLQQQLILMSHAIAITLALPFFSLAIQGFNGTPSSPSSVIYPSQYLKEQVMPWLS
ncbi:MAG: hypothetical protein HC851_07285 [Acaryochloris sp. RU_4_1]|nr:hypothetical protein [Acaryochloris sp. RU_4_1]NJR53352.1 hypothetical protein [Acaryochloris sp. CRU_2_0]